MNWKKAHIISRWIFTIGFAPLQYIFVGFILLTILLSLIPKLESIIDHTHYGLTATIIIATTAFFPYLYFIVKQLKETTYDDFTFHFSTVKFGIVLNYLGHLGLISIYFIYLYCLTYPSGSCSGFFIIPSLFWMFVFYLLGMNFTSLNRNIYKTKRQLDQLLQNNAISEEQYQEYLSTLYQDRKINLPDTTNESNE